MDRTGQLCESVATNLAFALPAPYGPLAAAGITGVMGLVDLFGGGNKGPSLTEVIQEMIEQAVKQLEEFMRQLQVEKEMAVVNAFFDWYRRQVHHYAQEDDGPLTSGDIDNIEKHLIPELDKSDDWTSDSLLNSLKTLSTNQYVKWFLVGRPSPGYRIGTRDEDAITSLLMTTMTALIAAKKLKINMWQACAQYYRPSEETGRCDSPSADFKFQAAVAGWRAALQEFQDLVGERPPPPAFPVPGAPADMPNYWTSCLEELTCPTSRAATDHALATFRQRWTDVARYLFLEGHANDLLRDGPNNAVYVVPLYPGWDFAQWFDKPPDLVAAPSSGAALYLLVARRATEALSLWLTFAPTALSLADLRETLGDRRLVAFFCNYKGFDDQKSKDDNVVFFSPIDWTHASAPEKEAALQSFPDALAKWLQSETKHGPRGYAGDLQAINDWFEASRSIVLPPRPPVNVASIKLTDNPVALGSDWATKKAVRYRFSYPVPNAYPMRGDPTQSVRLDGKRSGAVLQGIPPNPVKDGEIEIWREFSDHDDNWTIPQIISMPRRLHGNTTHYTDLDFDLAALKRASTRR